MNKDSNSPSGYSGCPTIEGHPLQGFSKSPDPQKVEASEQVQKMDIFEQIASAGRTSPSTQGNTNNSTNNSSSNSSQAHNEKQPAVFTQPGNSGQGVYFEGQGTQDVHCSASKSQLVFPPNVIRTDIPSPSRFLDLNSGKHFSTHSFHINRPLLL